MNILVVIIECWHMLVEIDGPIKSLFLGPFRFQGKSPAALFSYTVWILSCL